MGKKVMTPFKMSPKQAGMIESIRKENPKAAKKIEAGIKGGDKKNKEDVPGPALMDQKYAAMMGGYSPIKKVGDKKSDAPKGFKSDITFNALTNLVSICNTDDKEVIWKCRRGTKELDILMSGFYYKHYKTASDSQKNAFIELLSLEDPIIYDLLLNKISSKDIQNV